MCDNLECGWRHIVLHWCVRVTLARILAQLVEYASMMNCIGVMMQWHVGDWPLCYKLMLVVVIDLGTDVG